VKAKQRSLGGPVDRYFKRQSHQLLGGELRWIFAVNNRSDDIGRQRRKAQEARDVAGRNVLLPGNSMQSQHTFLQQALLNVVGSSDDSQQCGIGLCLIIGVLDEHLHFTADAL